MQPQPAPAAGRGALHVTVPVGFPDAVHHDDAAEVAVHSGRLQGLPVTAATASPTASAATPTAPPPAAPAAPAAAAARTASAIVAIAVSTAVRAGGRGRGGRLAGDAAASFHRGGCAHVAVAERVRQVQRKLSHDVRPGVPHAFAPQG